MGNHLKEKSVLYLLRTVLVLYLLIIALPLPVFVLAQEAPVDTQITSESPAPTETVVETPATPVEEQPVTTPPTTQGPEQPTGPENTSYTYNSETGLWENQYYTWDPVTKRTAPKTAPTYSYNPETNHWDTEQFVYSPEQGKYIPQTVSAPTAPSQPNETVEEILTSTPESSEAKLSPVAIARPASLSSPLEASVAEPLNARNLSVTSYDDNDGSYYDLFFNASISNQLSSTATTGDASVLQNTRGGDAVTGSASVLANIINMLQSTWGSSGLAPNLYVADIQGDYVGDMIIDPTLLNNYTDSACMCGDLEVNAETNASIDNDIDLVAISGSATVSGNTTAGSATSGDASVLANVINMINSSIYSGNSFIGLLNINGNFEGDVLMDGSVTDQLIAANVPTEQISLCDCGDLNAIFNDTQTINNQVVTTAESGSANVLSNTTAGSANTGDASTNVTVFNVTGRRVAGQNAILVFVNVGGEWIGFITDAPSGSTAAAFGSGLTENYGVGDQEINSNSTSTINNNINALARSGDAEVSNNTRAGDASTGDASASVNLANITNSSFNLNGWFGLLFINVLGNWYGSYGTDTAYGDNIIDIPEYSGGQTTAGQGNIYSTTAASGVTPQLSRNNIRAYAVSFAPSDDDKPVVAAATDILPPSGPVAPEAVTGNSLPAVTAEPRSIANILLLSSIAVAYLLIFHGESLKSALAGSRRY